MVGAGVSGSEMQTFRIFSRLIVRMSGNIVSNKGIG